MHDEILTPSAVKLVPFVATYKDFYLVGGTALALYMGHRISVDFDLFSVKELPASLLQGIKRRHKNASVIVTYRAIDQLNLVIEGVKFTYLHYPYPLLDTVVTYKGISVPSVKELAAMKALAVGRRLSFKDYVDWYYLLKEGLAELSEVIRFAEKKFGTDFNSRLFLGQLVSLSDVPTQAIDFIGKGVSRPVIERFLQKAVKGVEF